MSISSNATDNSIIDRLKELEAETDPEFVIELINIYISETPKQIQNISKALMEKSHSALRIAAHALKGSSLNLGAKKLGSLCLKLEEIGKLNKDFDETISIKDIEEEYNNVLSILNSYKGGS